MQASSSPRSTDPADVERCFPCLRLLPGNLWLADLDGRGSWFNEGWSRLVGMPLDDALGAGWLRVLHPDDREAHRTALQEAITARRAFSRVARLQRPDGRQARVCHQAELLRDEAGRPVGYLGAWVEIPEPDLPRAAEKRLAELEAWQKLTVGRERRNLELKTEVNDLLAELGRPRRYAVTMTASDDPPAKN